MTHPAVEDLLDLVLARSCAACRRSGGPVCRDCAAQVMALVVGFGGPRPVRPTPCPPSMPGCVAAGPYAGPLVPLVAGHKDEGRRDVRPVLAALLTGALAAALSLWEPGGIVRQPLLLVPAPGSAAARRRRGGDPLAALAVLALRQVPARSPTAGPGPVLRPVLHHARRVQDQAGLASGARQDNLRGAVAVRRGADVVGRRCLLVDDVVTTGATLAESARALAAGGAVVVGAATVCATSRQRAGAEPRLSRRAQVG